VPSGGATGTILTKASSVDFATAWQAPPTYPQIIGLPAPLTSGPGIGTYQDPSGEIWIARNNVTINGVLGGWARARDVLRCRVFRTAAWTTPTTANNFAFDSVASDPYGIYNIVGSVFTVPLTGVYLQIFQAGASATAAGQWISVSINGASGSGNLMTAAGAVIHTSHTTNIVNYTAGSTFNCQLSASAALAGLTGNNGSFGTIQYLGTGGT
jgi:hypothetical protein